jgi:hypothetical protein
MLLGGEDPKDKGKKRKDEGEAPSVVRCHEESY